MHAYTSAAHAPRTERNEPAYDLPERVVESTADQDPRTTYITGPERNAEVAPDIGFIRGFVARGGARRSEQMQQAPPDGKVRRREVVLYAPHHDRLRLVRYAEQPGSRADQLGRGYPYMSWTASLANIPAVFEVNIGAEHTTLMARMSMSVTVARRGPSRDGSGKVSNLASSCHASLRSCLPGIDPTHHPHPCTVTDHDPPHTYQFETDLLIELQP